MVPQVGLQRLLGVAICDDSPFVALQVAGLLQRDAAIEFDQALLPFLDLRFSRAIAAVGY